MAIKQHSFDYYFTRKFLIAPEKDLIARYSRQDSDTDSDSEDDW